MIKKYALSRIWQKKVGLQEIIGKLILDKIGFLIVYDIQDHVLQDNSTE